MYKIEPLISFRKEITVPADKSISHRALLFSAIAPKYTLIRNLLLSDDTLATQNCLKRLGIKIVRKDKVYLVESQGKFFPVSSLVNLNAQQSGTTIRIISGLLVGQRFPTVIEASASLTKRPMQRVTHPLRLMGADIKGRYVGEEEYPPLYINPVKYLKGIDYNSPVSSAQVKSAIIFAALYAKGKTRITEPYLSRDHTERMLELFKGRFKKRARTIWVENSKLISPKEVYIPGDFSSASFFIALAALLNKTEITIKNVGINPSRMGFYRVLKRMGLEANIINKHDYFEPYADIVVKSSSLKGVKVEKREIPLMIDELPLLFVCSAFAKDETVIYGLDELKVKETDRINSMVYNLKKAGVDIDAKLTKQGWMLRVKGKIKTKLSLKQRLIFKSFGDHRTAMSLIIFGLVCGKPTYIDDIKCIDKSFPQFISYIENLRR